MKDIRQMSEADFADWAETRILEVVFGPPDRTPQEEKMRRDELKRIEKKSEENRRNNHKNQ